LIKEEFNPNDSGIIYCLSKKETEEMSSTLNQNGVRALYYHAGLDDWARSSHHRRWAKGEVQVIVATVAFGMGINKTDVRYVIHYTMGKSIETYYQESGRAGRDLKPARCILFFRPLDIVRQVANLEGQGGPLAVQNVYEMGKYASSNDQCRHLSIASHFGEGEPPNNHTCDICQGVCEEVVEGDYTGHAGAIANTLDAARSLKEDLTVLKLVDKWRGSKNAADKALAQALSKDQCEAVITHLVLQGILEVYIKFTSYSANAYVKSSLKMSQVLFGDGVLLRLPAGNSKRKNSKQKANASSGGIKVVKKESLKAVAPVRNDIKNVEETTTTKKKRKRHDTAVSHLKQSVKMESEGRPLVAPHIIPNMSLGNLMDDDGSGEESASIDNSDDDFM